MNSYNDAFHCETRDLLEEAYKNLLPKPLFRQDIVKRIFEAFSARRSVLLVGPPGVGKTAIIHGLAHEMRISRHRGLRELSVISFLGGTHYLGDWQTKAKAIFEQAKYTNSVLYFTDIWNLRTVGSSSNDPSTIFDYLNTYLQSGQLLILGEATEEQFSEIKKHPKLGTIFERIDVPVLTFEQQYHIVLAEIERLGLPATQNAVSRIFDVCQQFQAHSNGPDPALRLVKQVTHYQKEKKQINESEVCDTHFIDKVFSIYSGLPLFIISRSYVKPLKEIRHWFRERIIGQNEAIESLLEVIALYKSGLHDAKRPIGTFLFVGPTGVGKTELTKALAHFLFGSETRLLRFDMSEFKDYHAFETLVGSKERPSNPARLLDPVSSQPFQVILFDEIEKAHLNVWDLLLQLLDEGRLTAPKGGTVNFRNTIIIATSNVGASELHRNNIGFSDSTQNQTHDIRKSLEQVFRPELINRFQHIISFNALNRDDVKQIAKRELDMILSREGIHSRHLIVEVGEDVLEQAIENGYDKHYGARALKRELQKRVVLPIANFLLEQKVYAGALLKLDIVSNNTRVRLLETEKSRDQKNQAQPITAEDGKSYNLKALREKSHHLRKRLQELEVKLDKEGLLKKLHDCDVARNKDDFWDNRKQAYELIVQAEAMSNIITRLDNLNRNIDDIEKNLEGEPGRGNIEINAKQLFSYQEYLNDAWRELFLLGETNRYDVIIQIQPITSKHQDAQTLRDLLFNMYKDWAKARNYSVAMICEPLDDNDCTTLLIRGSYAYGYLKAEAGLHRLRDGEQVQVARIILAALVEAEDTEYRISHREAIKKQGVYHGRIRSYVEIEHSKAVANLKLQNAKILKENCELADELAPAWCKTAHTSDEVVRRYDLNPFLVRDPVVKLNTGKTEILRSDLFHELLSKRVEVLH